MSSGAHDLNGAPENLDLIWGVAGIARVLGLTERQTEHQLSKGYLPVGKQGGRWVASRAGLKRHFGKILGEGPADAP
jgi:hypothetical protein